MSAAAGALREVAAVFGVEFNDTQLQNGMGSISGAMGLLRQFSGLLASSAVVGTVTHFANQFQEMASRFVDVSESLGVGVTELQELQHAAQLSGISAEQMNDALGRLSLAMDAVGHGGGPAAAALHTLGVRVRESNGEMRSSGDVMDDIAENMMRIEEPTRRIRLAQDLFGRSGRRLVGILRSGEGGLAAMRAELAELGGGVTPEATAAADAYGDQLTRWTVAQRAVTSNIMAALLPALTWLATAFTHAMAAVTRITRGTNIFRAIAVVAAAVLATSLLPAIGRVASAMMTLVRAQGIAFIGVAALVLIVDDLITLFRGGRSVIGDFLDRMLGIGASTRLVRLAREAWEGLTMAVRDAGAWITRTYTAIATFHIQVGTAIASVASSIQAAFASAFQWIEDHTSGLVTRTWNTLRNSWVGRTVAWVGRGVATVARGAAAITGLPGVVGGVRSTVRDWRNMLGGRGLTETDTSFRARAAAASSANVTVGPTNINVNGSGDPRAVAREVQRLQRQRERAGTDAAHPQPQREG